MSGLEFLMDPTVGSFLLGGVCSWLGIKCRECYHEPPITFDDTAHVAWHLFFNKRMSLPQFSVLVQDPLTAHSKLTMRFNTNRGRAETKTFRAGDIYALKGDAATQIALVVHGTMSVEGGRKIRAGQWVDGHWLKAQCKQSPVLHDANITALASEHDASEYSTNDWEFLSEGADVVCMCWSYEVLRDIDETPRDGLGRLNQVIHPGGTNKIIFLLRGAIADDMVLQEVEDEENFN